MFSVHSAGKHRSAPLMLSRSPRIAGMRTREQLVRHVMGLFNHLGLIDRVGADRRKLWRFVNEASLLYRDNPYHNWEHAQDVTHSAAWMVTRPIFQASLTANDTFWLLVAAVVHDLDHPGLNNEWEVRTASARAQKYHNLAVLERHSLDLARDLLAEPECRFAEFMPEPARQRGDFLLEELLLATDFAVHRAFLAKFGAAVDRYPAEMNFQRPEFTLLALQALIKAADIGSTTKPFVQAEYWAERIMAEFWAQGRMEKAAGFPVGPLNDPERIDLPQSQIGFIRMAALDLFGLLARIEPELQALVQALHENVSRYAERGNGLYWAGPSSRPPDLAADDQDVRADES